MSKQTEVGKKNALPKSLAEDVIIEDGWILGCVKEW